MKSVFSFVFLLSLLVCLGGCNKVVQKNKYALPKIFCPEKMSVDEMLDENMSYLNSFRKRSNYYNIQTGRFHFGYIRFSRGRVLDDKLLQEGDKARLEIILYRSLFCKLSVKDENLVDRLLHDTINKISKEQLHLHASELRILSALLKIKSIILLKRGKTCEEYLVYLKEFKRDYLTMMGLPYIAFFVFEEKASFDIAKTLKTLSVLEANSKYEDFSFVIKSIIIKLGHSSKRLSELRKLNDMKTIEPDKQIMAKFSEEEDADYNDFIVDLMFSLMPRTYVLPEGEYDIWANYVKGVSLPLRTEQTFFYKSTETPKAENK